MQYLSALEFLAAFEGAHPGFEWCARFRPYDKNCELPELTEAHERLYSYAKTVTAGDGGFENPDSQKSNVTLFLVDLRNKGPLRMSSHPGHNWPIKMTQLIAQVLYFK